MQAKLRIKDAVFIVFGFALSGTGAHRRWREQRAIRHELTALDNRKSEGGGDASAEWRDYAALKRAIAHAQRRHASERPSPDARQDVPAHAPNEVFRRETAHEVSVIVMASADHGRLDRCLAALRQRPPGSASIEIIVAARACDREAIAETAPKNSHATLTFGADAADACNRAAQIARGRKLVILHDHALAQENWLQPLLDEADRDQGIGATGPALVSDDGRLVAAGARLHHDGRIDHVGGGEWPESPRYSYSRDVDLCPYLCLAIERDLFVALGGLDAAYATLPFAVADLCLKVERAGYRLRYCAASRFACADAAQVSDTTVARDRFRLLREWQETLDDKDRVRAIAFYLPQFHAIPENDAWWGEGFTEWTNVRKAEPNFPDHDQPRRPADLGYYDLGAPDVLARQVELARRYGIGGFCYYYYWFDGRRLLERPIERMLRDGAYDFPFCLCWANENWTRRWDGKEHEILIGQQHSDQDDRDVIADISRFFAHGAYIRIRRRPLILVYRTDLFPDFARTAEIWRESCRRAGIGEIFIARVETSFGKAQPAPWQHGCDAAVEFPPHNLGDLPPIETGNRDPSFKSFVVDYRAAALQYAGKAPPAYPRFPGAMPGWDNTARRQKDGACFHRSTPGAFQAWFESSVRLSKQQFAGDERLVFVNAWNEWAEGAYLEPDQRYGHAYLQAAANALDADRLLGEKP